MKNPKNNKRTTRKGPVTKRHAAEGGKGAAQNSKRTSRKGPVTRKHATEKGAGEEQNSKRSTQKGPGTRRPTDGGKPGTAPYKKRAPGKGPAAGKPTLEGDTRAGKGNKREYNPGKRKPKSAKSEEIRLNKFMAHAGVCSRREADKLIEAGLVSVNGKIITEVGTKVLPDDDVRYNGERLGNERKVYLLLNKPKDYVTTVDDPHAKKTVMELVSQACKERIYPVGRLDKNTTGVLLFTNDGDLTRKLTHPSFNKKKTYHVFLDKNLVHSDLKKIAEGIELEDGFIQVDAIAYASKENKKEVGIEIHSGKNRIVRRLFEHLGYKVTKLDRVYFAGMTKKNLARGRWRFLTEKEIKMLKMNAFE